MRRRGVGVGAVKDLKTGKEKFKEKGSSIQDNQIQELGKQLDSLKNGLEAFAKKHKDYLKKNAEFREHFQVMCAQIGVDPIASSKGFWEEFLGMGKFYYELAVLSVEIVLSTTPVTGGMMTVTELIKRVHKSKGTTDISEDDILRAVHSMKSLGKSCDFIEVGKEKSNWVVYCVPEQLSIETTLLVKLVSQRRAPYIELRHAIREFGWSQQRATYALRRIVREGIAWVDVRGENTRYYFYSIFIRINNKSKS